MERWCLGAKQIGESPATPDEVESMARLHRIWERRYWLSLVCLMIVGPYLILSVVGCLLGWSFMLQGGFLLAMLGLFPLVPSAFVSRDYGRLYRALGKDLADLYLEEYAIYDESGALTTSFRRAPNSGLLFGYHELSNPRGSFAPAQIIVRKSDSPDFPVRLPNAALRVQDLPYRALTSTEIEQMSVMFRRLPGKWPIHTLVLGMFVTLLLVSTASDGDLSNAIGIMFLLLLPGYCAVRWFRASRLKKSLSRDIEDGIVLEDVSWIDGDRLSFEYLPHSGVVWTCNDQPHEQRA